MLADFPAATVVKLSLGLVVLVIVGWVTVLQVRRRLTQPDESSGAGFTLSDLRRLHKSGQMTDAEFERAKAKVVEAARKVAERDDGGAAGPGGTVERKPRLPGDDPGED